MLLVCLLRPQKLEDLVEASWSLSASSAQALGLFLKRRICFAETEFGAASRMSAVSWMKKMQQSEKLKCGGISNMSMG